MPTPSRRPDRQPDQEALAAALKGAQAPLRKAPPTDVVRAIASPAAATGPPASVSTPADVHDGPPAPLPREPKVRSQGGKEQVKFYADPAATARARGAYVNTTYGQTGHKSWSEFLAAAVAAYTESLEQRYNDGKPWPPMEVNDLPRGRPVGG